MKIISNLIKRYSVLSFFLLAYGIAWGVILVVAGSKGFRADRLQLTDIMLMFAAMLLGPGLAGLILTAIAEGKSGLRTLLSRMVHWRVGVRWYVMALLFPVVILVVLTILTAFVSPAFTPTFSVIGIVIGLLAGFFEEIGWTGYALPRLQLKHSPLAASLMLGVLWGFWHMLADYFGNSISMGALWLPYFLLGFVAAMTATRIIITWVYNNTGSILLAQLMHASSTGFLAALGISVASPIGPQGYALAFVVYAVALWVVVAIIVARYGKKLIRQTTHTDVTRSQQRGLVSSN
jgi:membrane protease YdiL (CAAX protease family)